MTRASKRERTLRPRRSKGGGVVYFLLVMLVLLVASVIYVGVRLVNRISTVTGPMIATPLPVTGVPKPTPNPLTEPLNILLLGVDRREGLEGTRSDVNIVVHIDPRTRFASMLSIPRDTRVYIPDYGYYKINAAYMLGERDLAAAGGGPTLAKRTVAAFLGIPIDYYAEVDFQGFQRIIDYLGGITVDVPYPLVDNEYPTENFGYTRVYIPSGLQHMDGVTALQYARSRHADSDFYRNRRQRQVLLAIRDRALSLNLISDMDQIDQLLGQFANTFKTDIQLATLWDLSQLAPQIERDKIASYDIVDCLRDISGTSDLQPLVPCVEERVQTMLLDPTVRKLREEGARIEVLNGTLTCAGCAASTAQYLRNRGFIVPTYGNAENAGYYTHTLILDSGDHPFTRGQLVKLLNVGDGFARQGEPLSSTADIVIILGDDFKPPTP